VSDRPHAHRGLTEADLATIPSVGSREELDAAFTEVSARFHGEDVPLPPHWGGYRLEAESIEFWQGREHRLHDRFRFTRDDGAWRVERLWP